MNFGTNAVWIDSMNTEITIWNNNGRLPGLGKVRVADNTDIFAYVAFWGKKIDKTYKTESKIFNADNAE